MNKKAIKIFTLIGIASAIFKVCSLLVSFFISGFYTLYILLDGVGELLFLSLFFFIIKDLRENYGKGVWPVYLFIFSTILLYITNLSGYHFSGDRVFIQLLFFVVVVIFILYLLRTAYKLFAIAFVISIVLMLLLRYTIPSLLSGTSYKYMIFLSAIPALYPLVLIYIVHTRNDKTMHDEINSIGSDIVE